MKANPFFDGKVHSGSKMHLKALSSPPLLSQCQPSSPSSPLSPLSKRPYASHNSSENHSPSGSGSRKGSTATLKRTSTSQGSVYSVFRKFPRPSTHHRPAKSQISPKLKRTHSDSNSLADQVTPPKKRLKMMDSFDMSYQGDLSRFSSLEFQKKVHDKLMKHWGLGKTKCNLNLYEKQLLQKKIPPQPCITIERLPKFATSKANRMGFISPVHIGKKSPSSKIFLASSPDRYLHPHAPFRSSMLHISSCIESKIDIVDSTKQPIRSQIDDDATKQAISSQIDYVVKSENSNNILESHLVENSDPINLQQSDIGLLSRPFDTHNSPESNGFPQPFLQQLPHLGFPKITFAAFWQLFFKV
jgi:hypothetical protein